MELLIVYILLLVITITLAIKKRTHWISILAVALIPIYFIWVLIDLSKSSTQADKTDTGIYVNDNKDNKEQKESYDVIIIWSITIIIALCASFLLSPIWGGPVLFWIGLVVAAFFLLAIIGSFLPKQHDEVIMEEDMFDYFNGGVVFTNEGSAKNQLKNKKNIEVPNIKRLKKSKNIKGLAKALSYKSSWEVRRSAALALGEIGDESAIKPLITTLKDRSIKVREATVIALAQIGGESVVDALQTALEDKEEIIQAAATDALGKLEHHTNRESQGLIENAISRQSDIPVKGKREPRKKQAVNETAKETKQNKIAKLKSGKDVELENFKETKATRETTTVLDQEEQKTAEKADIVKLVEVVNMEDFFEAIAEGNYKKVFNLLNQGAKVNVRLDRNLTPLHLAVSGKPSKSKTDITTLLLEHGAQVNVYMKDKGATPLHLAACGGNSEIVELLLSHGAEINSRDKEDATPLHMAVQFGKMDVVVLLLDHGADVNASSKVGTTSLHAAAFLGLEKIVKLLLDRGATVNARTKDGSTPLLAATQENRTKVVKLLKQHGGIENADDPKAVKFDRKMKQGLASYELYTSNDTEKAKEFLMEKKVKKDLFYIEVTTPNGTWGIDKDGLYLTKLLPWQKKINLHQCEGKIKSLPTIHACTVASQGIMDNAVAGIICGNCKNEWWDGISIKRSTIVRCPKCNFYNKIKGGQIKVSSCSVDT